MTAADSDPGLADNAVLDEFQLPIDRWADIDGRYPFAKGPRGFGTIIGVDLS